jgi:hypothetical protein
LWRLELGTPTSAIRHSISRAANACTSSVVSDPARDKSSRAARVCRCCSRRDCSGRNAHGEGGAEGGGRTGNIIFRGQQKFPHAPTGDMHVAQCKGVLTMKMAAPVKSSVSSRTCWYQAKRREGHTAPLSWCGVGHCGLHEAASSRPHTLLPAHQPSCDLDAW